MSYGTSIHAQRLAWQHQERTNGYEDDPSLAELLEVQDTEFRHWDTFIFARAASGREGCGTRERGAASSSDDDGGAPTNSPRSVRVSPAPCMADVTGHSEPAGSAAPSEAGGLAPSWQTWLWTS